MSVIPLTLTISLCLVFTFIVFFLKETSRRRFTSPERESLLPLGEETPRLAGRGSGHHSHKTDCGCRTGKHAPCPGCRNEHPHSHN